MGVPGPYNWRGALFKNAMFTGSLGDITFDLNWYQSAVEDRTSVNEVPEPVTNYYSYLGNTPTSTRNKWRRADRSYIVWFPTL